MKKKSILIVLLCVMAIALTACGSKTGNADNSASDDVTKKKIVIGTCTVSEDLANSGKEELEKMGYEVEIKVFDDYVLPNDALVDGSLDANLYQHEPYTQNYNDSNKTNIIMVEPKLYNYYSGLYSMKSDTIEGLPEGGKVGIAADAANINEQLMELQEAGLITLLDQPSSGEFYTVADIKENPHNYEFVNSDSNKYNNMDEYTCLIGTSNTMAEAGVDPTQHLLKKFVNTDLAEGLCIMEKNKDAQWVKDMMTAFTSDAAKNNVPASTGFEPAE